jgi:AAA15 family ATPase/GTPase
VVLIDEFENAIHADLLPAFAAHILALAQLFNVQVFLTSHSKEAIDAFAQNTSSLNEFSFHALVNNDEHIRAHHFSGKEFRDLLDIGDVDLRRAQ